MTDKDVLNVNSNKLPYIVLPSLSSKDGGGDSRDSNKLRAASSKPSANNSSSIDRNGGGANKAFARSNVQPEEASKASRFLPFVGASSATHSASKPESSLSPRSITSTKALSRHLALSKQFSSSVKEIQEAQKRILMAHYDNMKDSPRSFYPPSPDSPRSHSLTSINEECTGASANDDRYTRALGLSQLLRDQQSKQLEQQTQRRVSLDNLAQIFPHRVRKPKSTRGTKNETNKPFISPSSTSSSDEAIKLVAAKLAHLSSGEVLARTESSAAGDKSSDFSSRGQIKAKLDGLSVHIQTKDAELSQLKQDLIDLQLLVLKEKKESEKSRSAVHRLESEVQKLESKVESLECTVAAQEKHILDKLLLLDGMDTTDSDSDFGSTYCKPSNWTSSKLSSSFQGNPKPVAATCSSGGGTALRESNNWIPIAPDFDKLIGIISLMNARMDRNQSMKLQRKGNAVSFQHSDTINLNLYKNGLVLGRSGFRSYTSLSVIKLINETFQGYFPSELQSQYPEGVVFVVKMECLKVEMSSSGLITEIDTLSLRSLTYDPSGSSFCGEGNLLKDAISIPKLLPGINPSAVSIQRDGNNPYEAGTSVSSLSIDSKVSILPSSSNLLLCSLPALNCGVHACDGFHKTLVLKLKNSANGKAYKLQVSNSSSVNELLNHLEAYLPGDGVDDGEGRGQTDTSILRKYELVLPMPYGILTSGGSSLKEYGIIHNTLLYFKPTDSAC